MNKYLKEKQFIEENLRKAFSLFVNDKDYEISQKSKYDLVTDIDLNVENYLVKKITDEFPFDKILGEETSFEQKIMGRTWTIDPIDGTCNMAHGMKLFGMQCALFEDGKIVVSAMFLPYFNEFYIAIKGNGSFLNGEKISVKSDIDLNNAVVSFGDYQHKNIEQGELQHNAIRNLYPHVAKIRMFGSACIDFSWVASAKTDAAVVMTKNIWDIAPGILLCQEAGVQVVNIKGEEYTFEDIAVVVANSEQLSKLIAKSFS